MAIGCCEEVGVYAVNKEIGEDNLFLLIKGLEINGYREFVNGGKCIVRRCLHIVIHNQTVQAESQEGVCTHKSQIHVINFGAGRRILINGFLRNFGQTG